MMPQPRGDNRRTDFRIKGDEERNDNFNGPNDAHAIAAAADRIPERRPQVPAPIRRGGGSSSANGLR